MYHLLCFKLLDMSWVIYLSWEKKPRIAFHEIVGRLGLEIRHLYHRWLEERIYLDQAVQMQWIVFSRGITRPVSQNLGWLSSLNTETSGTSMGLEQYHVEEKNWDNWSYWLSLEISSFSFSIIWASICNVLPSKSYLFWRSDI